MNPVPFPGQLFFVRQARCEHDDVCILFSKRGNGILTKGPYWTCQALMDFLSQPCARCGSIVSVDTESAT